MSVSGKFLTLENLTQLLLPGEKGNVALTGGGGKTTLLGVLGRAFKSEGVPALLTTTTKIQRPFPVPVDWFVEALYPAELKREVLLNWKAGTLGMAVSGPYGDHKWDGISPETVDALYDDMNDGVILNEADGAFRLPIKAPAAHEPVIPLSTTLVIPVLGLSALGTPLDEAHAFRPHLIARITGLAMGDPITETAMARLISHPEGLSKETPSKARVIPFLNQADATALKKAGERIAGKILEMSSRIDNVLLGVLKPEMRVEILSLKP